MHDIGKIILDQFFHDDFIKAVKLAEEEKISLKDAEKKVAGLDPCEIGGWLSMKWRLADDVRNVILWHHDVKSAKSEYSEAAAIISYADYVCNSEKLGISGNPVNVLSDEVRAKIFITDDELKEIVNSVKDQLTKSELLLALK